MKTSELTGAALDWAVCVANGETREAWLENPYPYSTNWIFGGPIIEREGLTIGKVTNSHNEWSAESFQDDGIRVKYLRYGPTPLIAAMRCYVASKLGDNIDIPEELQ